MRSKSQQQQSLGSRASALGCFVAFSEMLTDLTPKPLIDKTRSSGAHQNGRRAPKPTT
jgi:hypothetical protein